MVDPLQRGRSFFKVFDARDIVEKRKFNHSVSILGGVRPAWFVRSDDGKKKLVALFEFATNWPVLSAFSPHWISPTFFFLLLTNNKDACLYKQTKHEEFYENLAQPLLTFLFTPLPYLMWALALLPFGITVRNINEFSAWPSELESSFDHFSSGSAHRLLRGLVFRLSSFARFPSSSIWTFDENSGDGYMQTQNGTHIAMERWSAISQQALDFAAMELVLSCSVEGGQQYLLNISSETTISCYKIWILLSEWGWRTFQNCMPNISIVEGNNTLRLRYFNVQSRLLASQRSMIYVTLTIWRVNLLYGNPIHTMIFGLFLGRFFGMKLNKLEWCNQGSQCFLSCLWKWAYNKQKQHCGQRETCRDSRCARRDETRRCRRQSVPKVDWASPRVWAAWILRLYGRIALVTE